LFPKLLLNQELLGFL